MVRPYRYDRAEPLEFEPDRPVDMSPDALAAVNDSAALAIPRPPPLLSLPLLAFAAIAVGAVVFVSLGGGHTRSTAPLLTAPARSARPITGLEAAPPEPFVPPAPADEALEEVEPDDPAFAERPSEPMSAPESPSFAEPPPPLPPETSNAKTTAGPALVVDWSLGPPRERRVDAARPPADRLLREGAVITAVLETKIGSGLQGPVRAMVSLDALSADGSTVIVPKGSRLTGRYEHGAGGGALRRILVTWTRLERPDGRTLSMAWPSSDPQGRAGVAGRLNDGFAGALGFSTLTSAINAGISSLGRSSTTQVIVSDGGNSGGRLRREPATEIEVEAGAVIQIHVTRDLDADELEPAG